MNEAYHAGGARGPAKWGTATITPDLFEGLTTEKRQSLELCRAFDVEQLLDRCLGSPQLVERVLASFELRFVEELDALRTELTGKDVEGVARLAHRLKGACANAAACELAALVADLETAARREQFDQAQAICRDMPGAWSRFIAAREAFTKSGRAS